MKKNTKKYIENKKKEGLYGIDWTKIKKGVKNTGWLVADDLFAIHGKIHGNRLWSIYFQKTKPHIIRRGVDQKMIKITVSF